MSSVVSHQILQQLGVIGIYADLIRHAEADGNAEKALAETRDKASAIEGALGDVNRVLTDLLVFGRDLRLNLYVHPAAQLVAEIVAECRAAAAERGVVLRSDPVHPVEPTVDKLKLEQALLNVVRNAIQASPRGGEVVIAATADGSDVVFSVSDQGAGVPQKDREAVFTPFFTTKEQGSGLGLAIARAFVEAHGGRIWVEPGRGGGAVFRVRLPIEGPGASATPAAL
jgi:signal transduction histidine kinase